MNKKILLADDNKKFCKTAEKILKKEGYKCKTVYNGKQVLEELDVEKYDIVLLDIIMPVMTGLEVCRKIKKKSTLKDIIVVMMSGNVAEIEISFDYGADDCFLKPVDWEKLLRKIESISRGQEV